MAIPMDRSEGSIKAGRERLVRNASSDPVNTRDFTVIAYGIDVLHIRSTRVEMGVMDHTGIMDH